MNKEISQWIENPNREYADGLRLLERYGTNPFQLRSFSNRSPRFAMSELVGVLRRLTDSTTKVQKDETKTEATAAPSVVDKAKGLIHDLWVKLSKIHLDLFDTGESNGEKEVAARRLMMDVRDPLIVRYNSLYEAKEIFFSGSLSEAHLQEVVDGKTVSEVLHPKPPKKETPLRSMSDLTLYNKTHAAKQAINRYNNQLRYQQDTAAKVDNPMPDCPRRDKILHRLKKKLPSWLCLKRNLNKGRYESEFQ